ncbi:MAG: MFS transporter [Deltaproteobacteria bacterium]|nr:MFS transporter [Deltaproteobacteria bacterium]
MGTIGTTKESEAEDNVSIRRCNSQEEAAAGQSQDRLFASDFVLATLSTFANAFTMQMLFVTLPLYVIKLGGSQAEAGLVSGIIAFTALLLRPFVGWLTDAWRRRPLILIGISGYGLASAVYLLAGSIPLLLLGRFVHGVGLCCYTTAANAYVADIAPLRRRAEAMGFFSAAQAVGLIIGPLVGFLLIGTFGFQYLFSLAAGLSLAAFLLSFFTQERRKKSGAKPQPWSPRTGIVSVESLPVAWMALCMGMAWGATSAFIAIFAHQRGLPNPGFYFMIQASALLVSRTIAGPLADRYGRSAVILPGIVLMAISLLMLPFTHDVPFFLVSGALFGFGFGIAQPATMALLIDRVQPERRGLAVGTYFTGYDSGICVGAILLGVVSQHWGFSALWLLAAACTLLGLIGLLTGRRRGIPAS